MREPSLRAIPALLILWLGVSASARAFDDAQFVSQSVPAAVLPGQSYAVSVTMQNIGNTTWTAGSHYRLGAQNPQDTATWGLTTVELPNPVEKGASVTFNFQVTAPAVSNTYNFQWRMERDNGEWFGASTPNIAVRDEANAAAFLSPGSEVPFQGQASYLNCLNRMTGAIVVAFTGLGVAATHAPSGGVAGFFVGAGVGHFLVGPLACAPDSLNR